MPSSPSTTQTGGGLAFSNIIGVTGIKKNYIKYIQPMSTEHFSKRLMKLSNQNLQQPNLMVGGRNFTAIYDLIQHSKLTPWIS